MNCNPAEFYPFSGYTWTWLLVQAAIALVLIVLGLIIYLQFRNRQQKGLPISVSRRVVTFVLASLGILAAAYCVRVLSKNYGYVTLPQNYQERHTKVISIDFNPKGSHLYKCVVKHKMEIDYKEIILETNVYNEEIAQHLRDNKSGKGTYWIYYNPKKPNIYLVDFRDTVDKQKSVCEEAR